MGDALHLGNTLTCVHKVQQGNGIGMIKEFDRTNPLAPQ
jgi:hypothetical protein